MCFLLAVTGCYWNRCMLKVESLIGRCYMATSPEFFFFLPSGPLRPPPNSHRTAQVAPLPGVWASDSICTIGLTLKLVWLELGVNHFLWTTSHSLTPVLLYSHLLGWINVQTQVNCAQSIWEQWERLFRWFSVCLFVCLSGSEFSHCTQSLD